MDAFTSQLIAGISRGALLFLVTAGLTLVFGVLRIVNFAHGAFYMLGAFLGYSITTWLVGIGQSAFWIALIVVPIIVASIGGIIEILLFRRIYKSEHLYQLLLTFALVYIIGDVVRIIWGSASVIVPKPDILMGMVSMGGVGIPVHHVFIIGLAVLVGLGLWVFLYRTRFGDLIRAAAADPQMLSALGVNCALLYTVVFTLGTWLAALGGAATTVLVSPIIGMDSDVILLCFVIIVIGGMGKLQGALVGALLIGVIESFGILLIPQMVEVLVFALMIIVLIFRPSGLFGVRMER